METNDDLEYHLDDPKSDDYQLPKRKCSKKLIIIITISSIVVILAIFLAIYFFVIKKDDKDNKNNNNPPKFFYNVKTAENGKIKNTFREGEANYIASLGNFNDGNDYEENERDNFDLCIPYSISQRKDKYNVIYLQLHGGGWVEGEKENITLFCNANAELDVITITMSYTLLNGTYPQSNIFRIMDEVNACVKRAVILLKNEGFDETKMQLALHGSSAGGHLAYLYAQLVKNKPLEVKFIFNNVGVMSLDPLDFWIIKEDVGTLPSIEPEYFEEAKKNGTIQFLNGNGYEYQTQFHLLCWMNLFLGRVCNDSFDVMYNYHNQSINIYNEKYQNLLEKSIQSFPPTHVTIGSPAVLCLYGGNDTVIGIGQYPKLKKAYIDANIADRIELIYFRYGGHGLDSVTDDGKNKMELIQVKRHEMIKKYFKFD